MNLNVIFLNFHDGFHNDQLINFIDVYFQQIKSHF